MISPHPHEIVAIIIRIVRVGIGHAYPKHREVPEVVTVVEAPTRHSAEACSAGHGGKPTSSKSAARGHTAVEGSATVETAATAVETATPAVSAATTATRGSIHGHRRNADCRDGGKSDQHFPEHGTLLLKGVAPDNHKPRSPQIIPGGTQIHFFRCR
jgi:hypothetical protein